MTEPSEAHYGVASPDQIAGLTGRQILEAMIARKLPAPPMAKTLAFTLVEVGEGIAVFQGDPGEALLNPMGAVHGGWALTLIDSATGCAAMTLLAAGIAYTTIETKVNFVRPILKDTGAVRAEAHVLARGRRVMSAEARVSDSRGRLLAHGASTLLVL
jgi:uncharacterized protein (TIGR00369 family)